MLKNGNYAQKCKLCSKIEILPKSGNFAQK